MTLRLSASTTVANTAAVLCLLILGIPVTYLLTLVGAGMGIQAATFSGGVIRDDVALIGGALLGSAVGVLAAGATAIGAARLVAFIVSRMRRG